MKPDELIYICNDIGIPVFGRAGSSIHIQEFLQAVIKQGVDPYLLYQTAGGELSFKHQIKSKKISSIPLSHNPIFMKYNISRQLSNFDLKTELKKNKY